MALLYSNNASSTLAADLAIGGTTLSLFAGTGSLFPNPTGGDYFKLTLEDSMGNIEIVHCTARSTDSCTITRAQEGTPARAFSAGAAVENRFTAGSIATFNTYSMASNAEAATGTATNLIMNPATTKYFWDQRVTPFAATVLDDTDASSALTTLGVSTYAKTLLDDTDAATMHTTLGLGTAATKDAGVGAGELVQLDANARIPAVSGALLTGITASQISGLSSGMPTGAVVAVASSTVPSGFLECNGAAVNRTTYAALFAAIGVVHGYGDNSTTFNLPDYRGRFLRGWDHAIARDPDRASRTAMNTGGAAGDNIGSVQAGAVGPHQHKLPYMPAGAGGEYSGAPTPNGSPYGSPHANDVATHDGTIGSETRPINANVMYCIKY